MRIRTWNPRPVTRHELLAVLASGGALVGAAVLVALGVKAYSFLTGGENPSWTGAAMGLAAMGSQAATLTWFLRRRGWRFADLGLTRLGRRGWHLLWQIPACLVACLTAVLTCAALIPGLTPTDYGPGDADTAASGQTWLLVTIGLYLLFGPFVEEVVFRRLLMGWCDRRIGVIASTVVTSAVFGAVHVFPAAILWTAFMGLGCALLVRWHRSLWAGFILHMVNNLVASAGLLAALVA